MPLRAIIDGQPVTASLLAEKEWLDLQTRCKAGQAEVRLPCCNTLGQLTTSKLGTPYFVHSPRAVRTDACEQKENPEHLLVKAHIAAVCQVAGFETIVEAVGNGWRADVLARKESYQIAFEIVWSRLPVEEVLARQQVYASQGMSGVWFFKRPPTGFQDVTTVLPLFPLWLNDDQMTISLSYRGYWSGSLRHLAVELPLHEIVNALLKQKLRYSDMMRAHRKQMLQIVFFQADCYWCRRRFHLYYASEHTLTSVCGNELEIYLLEDGLRAELFPEVVREVKAFLVSDKGKHLQVGEIKTRYSQTRGEEYMSFGCPHCDGLVGDWYLSEMYLEAKYHENQSPAMIDIEFDLERDVVAEQSHWCMAGLEGFCED